jgi:uncharacterized repeat protein (TIGR01451 family)
VCLSIAAVWSLSSLAHAGTGVWTTGGPYGGPIHALAIDPTTPATLYAGTYGGVFKSTTSAGAWTAANTGLSDLWVNALAIDPTTPATLYAGTYGGGVFKSTDSGATWVAVNTGLTNLRLWDLAVDPVAPATLFAGTSSGGVFKSTDSGGTWATANTGLTDLWVRALAIDPTAPATIYVATFRSGVFKSTNSGGNWAAANAGLQGRDLIALAIDPLNPATLYAGAYGGPFKSTNAGGTWVAANTGVTGLAILTVATDPVSPATLYAGSYWDLFKSINAGASWTVAGAGLMNLDVWSLAIDPWTPATLYAGTWSGVFRSTNGGSTWAAANNGLDDPVFALAVDPTNPTTLYAGTHSRGVFKSTNSGATWVPANTGVTNLQVGALAIDPTNPTTLYAGTASSGVFRSTNSAGSWIAANAGLSNLSVRALAISPTSPATLYAGTAGGVFKSTNSGGSWAAATTGLTKPSVYTLAIDPSSPTTLYAGTYGDGVFKSINSGDTWALTAPGLKTTGAIYGLAVDPTSAGTLHAGTDGSGVWEWTSPPPTDLTLTLSDSPDPVIGSTPLTYTLAVSNAGPNAASSLSVSHTLPAGVVFGSAAGSGWTCGQSGGVVTCTRPSLSVGAAPDITVQVTPGPTATVLSALAIAQAAESDPNPANNSDIETTTVVAPYVSMGTRTKKVLADSGEFVVNEAVTYTIALANTGNVAQADDPGHELVDTLPSGLALVSASATSGAAAADLPTNTVSWDGSLASGGSVTIAIHATIRPTVALGATITNQATVSYDADANGTHEATTLTDDPDQPGASDPTSFVVASAATDFYTLTPCRLVDTRNAVGTYGGPALVAGGDRVLPLSGQCDIPPTARALSVNLTVSQPTANGNLRLYPAGTPLPPTSAINYVAGQTRANNAIAPLNGLGELAIRCSQASVTAHFILDVNGYFE